MKSGKNSTIQTERIRIEPDWNVNYIMQSDRLMPVGIRIEPDWNVNYARS